MASKDLLEGLDIRGLQGTADSLGRLETPVKWDVQGHPENLVHEDIRDLQEKKESLRAVPVRLETRDILGSEDLQGPMG